MIRFFKHVVVVGAGSLKAGRGAGGQGAQAGADAAAPWW